MLSALAKRVHSHALHAPRLRISTLGAVGTRKSEDCDRWHLAVESSMAKQQRLELASNLWWPFLSGLSAPFHLQVVVALLH